MSKMYVYRLEDSNGQGIHWHNAPAEVQERFFGEDMAYTYAEMAGISDDFIVRPRPVDDPALEDIAATDEIRFGFSSIEQYVSWVDVPLWREKLASFGIKLNKYEVDDESVVEGAKQLVFLLNDARLIESLSPVDILVN